MIRVFVPGDSGARSVGADAVAQAIAVEAGIRGQAIEIVRNGSRGAYWLEPLVEVATSNGRVGYGNVTAAQVPSLFDAGFLDGKPHATALGPVDQIEFFARQQRVTFRRVGITDPLSVAEYEAHGGLRGLKKAVTTSGADLVDAVTRAGLRGRGGAAFPTGIKWKTVLNTSADQKYIVCNADEGDSGTFADRMLMEGDPFLLIEGMAIAGLAVGATQGFIYLRSEYPDAHRTLDRAIAAAQSAGFLGDNILGSGRAFHLEVRLGAGSYVCGEETALLESLEGKRGMVRPKPPLPAIAGLFGKPTVINNVLSLAAVPDILADGADAYAAHGTGRSRGTLPFQLGGNIRRGGLVELPFGATVREVLEQFGGGSRSGRAIRAVQVGGPLGAYLPAAQFDTPLDYEAFIAIDAMLGHGGIVVFDDSVDLGKMARFAMEFCAIESCGKCTPCRIGSTRGVEVMDKVLLARAAKDRATTDSQVALLKDLCDTMLGGSLCAMGGMTPYPVLSALRHFPEDFGLAAGRTA